MDHCITPEFAQLIGQSRLKSLNDHSSAIYGLDSQLRLAYLNPAWFRFAQDNSADDLFTETWALRRPIFDAIPEVLLPFYEELHDCVMGGPQKIHPDNIEYECSSPTLYRWYAMHLYPLGDNGVVVVNSLLVEEPHEPPEAGIHHLDSTHYIDENGFVLQCANCRRFKNRAEEERWDWIPQWVEQMPPKTSHGICWPCKEHFYPSVE
jgi:hypothetical protein